ncbi:MAG: hypothetical protein R2727_04725 [Bacteroidales bacterium]
MIPEIDPWAIIGGKNNQCIIGQTLFLNGLQISPTDQSISIITSPYIPCSLLP